jgi:hypothetical protein
MVFVGFVAIRSVPFPQLENYGFGDMAENFGNISIDKPSV